MKKSELLLTALSVPLDYLALLAAALLAHSIRFLPSITAIRPVVFELPFDDYLKLAAVIALVWIGVFALAGLYRVRGSRKLAHEVGRVFLASAAAMAAVMAVMFFTRLLFDSRFVLLVGWGLAVLFVSLERIALAVAQRMAYKSGFGVHRAVVIGDTSAADRLIEVLSKQPVFGLKPIGRWSEFNEIVAAQLNRLVEHDAVDTIIDAGVTGRREQSESLVNFTNIHHLEYLYLPDVIGTRVTGLKVSTIGGIPVVEVKRTPLDGWGRIVKRFFDILASIILLIISLPFQFLIALFVKIDSTGPVFFTYRRVGQRGRPFTFVKFRSMVEGAHKMRYDPEFQAQYKNLREGSPMIKFKNDPRITKVGKFIRRFSLDEIPQLWLVLAGKLSLVGPRPHEVEEVAKYDDHHRLVLSVKPGVTGLAQVSGRSDLNFEEEVRLDLHYIENWSLALDLQVLFRTPWAVLRNRQSE